MDVIGTTDTSHFPGQYLDRDFAGPWTVYSLGFAAPYRTALFSYDESELAVEHFRVRTLYSGLSAGTELTHFKGSNQYLHKTWDETLKLFRPGPGSQSYPMMFSGYMEVGEVCASRCQTVRPGEVVAMSYGHKSGHTADAYREFYVRLPAELDPLLGIYVAQMGPICANAILHADEDAHGAEASRFGCGVEDQHIMVFGAGVVGLLTAMLARWAGAAEVAVADTGERRLAAARRLGFEVVDVAVMDPALWAKERWSSGPSGDHGADLAFQCRALDEMLAHAFNCLRPQGAVIDLAFYQTGAPNLLLGEAFHHNGLRHIATQIFRVPRKLQHMWNRRRLSEQTIKFLLACGNDLKRHIINDVVPISQAQRVFEEIAAKRWQPLQVVFAFEELTG
jgi:threonine dehydrogenase-like Zn-dependent dehydrogenase